MTITHLQVARLIGQRKACRGDSNHSPRCKRCARGRATTHRPTKPANG
ncbi:hypothetical protein L5G28_07510 [Gordonia sp. HY285]|nr:hypothetical protein [Gordonia liuliyuniae]MCF8610007.1 hypothetical protein [Gordonia liuliyuniae]